MAGAFLVSWKFPGAFVYMICQVKKHNHDNVADQDRKERKFDPTNKGRKSKERKLLCCLSLLELARTREQKKK